MSPCFHTSVCCFPPGLASAGKTPGSGLRKGLVLLGEDGMGAWGAIVVIQRPPRRLGSRGQVEEGATGRGRGPTRPIGAAGPDLALTWSGLANSVSTTTITSAGTACCSSIFRAYPIPYRAVSRTSTVRSTTYGVLDTGSQRSSAGPVRLHACSYFPFSVSGLLCKALIGCSFWLLFARNAASCAFRA